MSSLTPTHRAILDLLVEDSYGLWEIAGRFQDLFPDRPIAEAKRIARERVQELLDSGLVSLWSQEHVDGDEVEVSGPDASARLAEDSNWENPDGTRPQFRLLATELGEQAYYASE